MQDQTPSLFEEKKPTSAGAAVEFWPVAGLRPRLVPDFDAFWSRRNNAWTAVALILPAIIHLFRLVHLLCML